MTVTTFLAEVKLYQLRGSLHISLRLSGTHAGPVVLPPLNAQVQLTTNTSSTGLHPVRLSLKRVHICIMCHRDVRG